MTIHIFVQQEEIQKTTRKTRIKSWNQSDRDIFKELNAKAYVITIKENKVLNQWLDKQINCGIKFKICDYTSTS